ncbi:MAG TPA: cellulase family glycosylhydrolase [Candidatus Saccharimonadales bacterium]|nr:cellulase family glycosylhydrolase [Candidatus Saccharimonadales bacterium]
MRIQFFSIVFFCLILVGVGWWGTHRLVPIATACHLLPTHLYGASVDMANLVPGTAEYTVNRNGEDLIDIAHRLGLNVFRLTVRDNALNESPYSQKQWDSVLSKMRRNGIWAIILPESRSPSQYVEGSENLSQNHSALVEDFVVNKKLGQNPDVIAVDIKNEVLLTDHNLKQLEKERELLKSVYPSLLLTAGGWKTDTGKKDSRGRKIYNWNFPKDGVMLSNVVDFYAVHLYGFDKSYVGGGYPDPFATTATYVGTMRDVIGNAPVLIEEFGAGNGDAVTDADTLGSKELAANVYAGVLQAATTNRGILGALAWIFYRREAYPDGWTIVNDNGNYLYPAAYVMQKFATGQSQIQLDLPMRITSQDFLFTNIDSRKVIKIKVGDRIGLVLAAQSLQTKDMRVSGSNILDQVSFFRDLFDNDFKGVFVAKNAGQSTITVPHDGKTFVLHVIVSP